MKLNSWTEWGELKEVVVGHCSMLDVININHSFRFFFETNVSNDFLERSVTLKKRFSEQRQEDLDQIAQTLERLGIKTLRPLRPEVGARFRTPVFEEELIGAENIRDQSLIFGDEIIETSPLWDRRYFENELLKEIFNDYFEKGARWTCSPKSRMRESDYDRKFISGFSPDEIERKYSEPSAYEIMFDGAQCLRFGRDIVMNVSTANHWKGLQWLRRHLGDRARIHPVNLTDHHIDGMFMPLREGLLLINCVGMQEKVQLLPDWLKKWKIIRVPEPLGSEESILKMASANINVNVLPLSPKKTLVFEENEGDSRQTVDLLVQNGLEPIVVRLRHSRIFAGGLHCVTLDTVREDGPVWFSK